MKAYNYIVNDSHVFTYEEAILKTDPATGRIYIFDGGYFRRDGIFVKSGAFKIR